jgi:hypothetical protein
LFLNLNWSFILRALELAEGSFFQLFLAATSKLGLPPAASNGVFKDFYLPFWREFDGKNGEPRSFAVADGSGSSTTFRGGLRVAVVRAIANVYCWNSLAGSVSDVDVKVGHRLRRASLYMRSLEFKCLREALDSHGGVSMALCDGDLYPTIHPVLVRLTTQEVQAYVEYLNAFYELYRFAAEKGILLVGITKDSFVNYLGAKVLAHLVSQGNPDLGRELSRVRSIRNIERKLSEKRGQLKNCEVYLKEAERMLSSSDEETFDACTTKPGFTVPLVLAPQPIFLSEEISAGTMRWADSKIRGRLLGRGPPFTEAAEAFDRLYGLPPVVMSYWRPWHGLGVYRVDVGGWMFGLKVGWGTVESDYFLEGGVERFREVAAALNGLSPEPFTVKPLLDADDLVRFSVKTYKECYEPIIVQALRRAGLKPSLTKRELRELTVRT